MGLLDGKVAIITGAASGIGKAQASVFVKEGAKVVLADLNEEGIIELSKELSSNGDNALAVKTNVLDQDNIKEMVDQTIKKFGKVDILCNTAGAFDELTPILDTSEELWDKVMNLNTKTLYLVTKEVLPHMIENDFGKVISISSGAGLKGGGGGISYTTSKHAVIGFARQVASDYKNQGIRSNAICPGLIETPMTEKLRGNKEFSDAVIGASGRLGQAEDIANASLYLASDLGDYVNASTLPVDGGLTYS